MRARGSSLGTEREALAERRVSGAAVVGLALIVGAMGCNSRLSAIHDVDRVREASVHFQSGDNTTAERPGSNLSIEEIPGADHRMRSEQPDGRRIIAPGYLDAMSRWLRRTLGFSVVAAACSLSA